MLELLDAFDFFVSDFTDELVGSEGLLQPVVQEVFVLDGGTVQHSLDVVVVGECYLLFGGVVKTLKPVKEEVLSLFLFGNVELLSNRFDLTFYFFLLLIQQLTVGTKFRFRFGLKEHQIIQVLLNMSVLALL